MSIRIYVEGGGDQRATSSQCRAGFGKFFSKIASPGRLPQVRACGSRQAAFDDFNIAVKKYPDDFVMLLVDAEAAVISPPWDHLSDNDGWGQPSGSNADNAQLMVQIMEAWFLSDRLAMAEYFGQGFNENALPGQPNIELIDKQVVLDALKKATSKLKTKRPYDQSSRVKHGFALLGLIDPQKLSSASVHAKRLIDQIVKLTA